MGLFGDLISALTTPSQSKKVDFMWLLFGAKGSGKHEFLATIAQEYGCVEGIPHAKDFEDEWQKSFQTEIANDDEDGNMPIELNINCLLLEPNGNDAPNAVENAKNFTTSNHLYSQDRIFPCFFINLEKFVQNEEAELQLLFAQMLFYWRLVYSFGCYGHFDHFDADFMESMNDEDAWAEIPKDLHKEIYLFATHLDKISADKRESAKKKFYSAFGRMQNKASSSVFGELFKVMFEKMEITVFYEDLFHSKSRTAAFSRFLDVI